MLTNLQKITRENMRACIVLEMSCTGFCLTSVLVQTKCDAWWWEAEGRHGSVVCRCRFFLSGTVGLQVDVFAYSQLLFLCRFCIFEEEEGEEEGVLYCHVS